MSYGDPACLQCNGTGFVVRADDQGYLYAERCACARERWKAALLARSGIPPRFAEASLRGFRVPEVALFTALERCRAWLDEWRPGGKGLYLAGPPGVGKTHLVCALLVGRLNRGTESIRFIDFPSLIGRLQATFSDGATESRDEVLAPYVGAELLAIDELGQQKTTAFVSDTLYNLVNRRYVDRKTTLFTSNFALSGTDPNQLLENRLPPMLVSRLSEMADEVQIVAADYRKRAPVQLSNRQAKEE